MRHKFGFQRNTNGEGIAGIIHVINFIALEGFEADKSIRGKMFISVCWAVDPLLKMYPHVARVSFTDLVFDNATMGAANLFRRAKLGVTRAGRQIG